MGFNHAAAAWMSLNPIVSSDIPAEFIEPVKHLLMDDDTERALSVLPLKKDGVYIAEFSGQDIKHFITSFSNVEQGIGMVRLTSYSPEGSTIFESHNYFLSWLGLADFGTQGYLQTQMTNSTPISSGELRQVVPQGNVSELYEAHLSALPVLEEAGISILTGFAGIEIMAAQTNAAREAFFFQDLFRYLGNKSPESNLVSGFSEHPESVRPRLKEARLSTFRSTL